MKFLISAIMVLTSFSLSIASCSTNETAEPNATNQLNDIGNPTNGTMKITIGSSVFTATFYDNATATAFKSMLPLTINMSELNGNEKFFYFSNTLPTNPSVGGTIQVGDLMLYGNNCLVLFYESFNTSYSYSQIGKITNTTGLVNALSSGNIDVKFELE
ncbi:cyclophilin-like fold protein [Flavobacterium aquiphilum]|uniref:cyclophilin-like fold protein n=1 Tax=Flavobacterium aquiphilum TaxID=3003261 RepID=UPI00248126F2|nr:cyclophilin-like fold protein [Flavobacterium aquiphilum]